MRRTWLIIAASLMVVGCGGGEDEVRETLETDRLASERLDWDTMCTLRTEAGRRELAMCGRPDPEEEAATDVMLGNEPIVTFLVKQPRVADVDVDDDRATVRYEDGSVTRLRKVDGSWFIDSPW